MPVETLYRQLRKVKQFTKDTGETIQDIFLVRSGYNNIEDTGLFTNAYYEWRMFLRTAKSWKYF